MNATLTQRYLDAAARAVPESQRDELRRELTERIGDGIDARIHDGAAEPDAEYLVLAELGDPDALVAQYLDRPQFLLGPSVYQLWKRLLRILLLTVVPLAGGGVALGQALAHGSIGDIAAATTVTVVNLTVHLTLWSIVVFAIIERVPSRTLVGWTPESLPTAADPERTTVRADLIANFVFIALIGAGVVLHPHLMTSPGASGEPVALFPPDTGAWLPWYLAVILLLDVSFWVALYRRGRWGGAFVAVRLALSAALTLPLAWLAGTGRLFDGRFFSALGWSDGTSVFAVGGAAAVLATMAFVAATFVAPIDGFIKSRRSIGARAGGSTGGPGYRDRRLDGSVDGSGADGIEASDGGRSA